MTSPEAMYAAMTSGDPGAVAALQSDVDRAMGDTTDEIGTIRYAEDTPDWDSPSARTRFNMRAWATRAAAEVASLRLNRSALALRAVEQSYRDMLRDASATIDVWRRTKASATDALSLLLLRAAVISNLDRARRAHATRVAQATQFMVDDPFTADQEEWLENGLLRSLRHDLQNPGELGPVIPGTLATGDDDGFIPQGLGYGGGYLLQTSYTSDGDAQLSLIDPETGLVEQTVNLGKAPGGDTAPDHAGGVAVHDGRVYVTSSDDPPRLFAYDLSTIERAAPGSTVPVLDDPVDVAAGAYSTVVGDTLYVGTHNEHGHGALFAYTWDEEKGWTDRRGPFATPAKGQGVAIEGDHIVFSSSLGRGNGSTLTTYRLEDVLGSSPLVPWSLPEPVRTLDLPNMSEGIAALPEGLLTTYESGAGKYAEPSGSASLEDLWAAMNMTLTPYSELGIPGGTLEVEPVTLSQAADLFVQVQAGLDSVERRVGGLSLGGGVLGDIPEGALFATAVTRHLDETARWLDEGRLSAELTADGLVTSATSYEESDADSGGLLGRLRSLIP
ncbi:YncE family protein [Nocardioides deserti]|uniref:Uncharacterized protein n=1 Tax=Nocardioides deserti TaxID=1588644 RepID=A0ABR6U535_9ACTN|nr:hypothetical protein [Nocardioides deserti]MBC2959539.1 hypothetical protein [Nocardioides deserti]GGO73831.1 hypothetical protein GCM10012276_20390 [Nocardioides deserti]